MTDPFVGQLAFIRVYSGQLGAGESVFNVAKNRKERIGRLVKMHANKREEIHGSSGGRHRRRGRPEDRLDRRHDLRRKAADPAESIDFPAPVIQLAIEPKTKADQEKLGMAIAKLVQEDPTLRVNTDPDTGQTILGRHGRAASRDHRRPHAARVQCRRQRRQAAGGLSRDDSRTPPSTITRIRRRPAAAASTRT